MYPGVELRLYRYVSVLADELNFTQAALRLRVAQPTLSTQIRDLEREIGANLFERTRGGQQVVLTASGEAFVNEARRVLLHADRAIQEARAALGRHKGVWQFGYSPLVDLRVVSKIRRYLSDAHPAADFRFVSGHTSEHVDALLHRRLDAGIVILPAIEDRVAFEPLYRERLILALPKQHSLAKKEHIEVTDLHELPLVKIRGDIEPRFGRSLQRLFSLIRVRPRFFHETTTQSEALGLVSTDGVAAITTPVAVQPHNDGVVFRNFADEILTVETGLAYHAESASPVLKSLRQFLAETYQPFGHAAAEGHGNQMILF